MSKSKQSRCKSNTQSGSRCQRTATLRSCFCKQHAAVDARSSDQPLTISISTSPEQPSTTKKSRFRKAAGMTFGATKKTLSAVGTIIEMVDDGRAEQSRSVRVLTADEKQKIKPGIHSKQERKCAGCRRRFAMKDLEIDHRTPRSAGGTNEIRNLQLLCSVCNKVKGNRSMEYLLNTARIKDIRRKQQGS